MKVRIDFVTNSSSSSFVISYKDVGNVDEETLKKYPMLKYCDKLLNDVLTHVGDWYETNEGFKITSKQEFDDYLDERRWRDETIDTYIDDEYGRDRYNDYINRLNNGEVLYFKSVDYNDRQLRDTLSSMADDGIIEILEDENE